MKGSSGKPRQKFSVNNYEQKKTFKKKLPEEKVSGLGVKVHGDDITKALRIFKKKILKADILNEARERQHYTKKSEKKKPLKTAKEKKLAKRMKKEGLK